MILDTLVQHTQRRLAAQPIPTATLRQQALARPKGHVDAVLNRFRQPGLQVIGEVKQASPSKGQIVTDFPYLQIAQAYAAAGIDAISVLTEPDYFHGDLAYLQTIANNVDVPVLRKDFTLAPSMLYQAKLAGADMVLLIVAILTDAQLRELQVLADDLGLAAIVEVHNRAELTRGLVAGARLIGINNRDLTNFKVDLNRSISLRPLVPAGIPVIAESGIQTAADMARLRAAKLDGVLIGETLMRAPDKAAKLAELKGSATNDQN